MSERQQRLRLGLFTAITLSLLALFVVVFGDAPRWFTKTNPYTITFSDAPGVAPGTPIRKSGIKIGEVSSVDLDDETGQAKVAIRIEPKFILHTNEEPTISRGFIVGDTAIDFVPKAADVRDRGERIPPGSIIKGVSPFNARAFIEQATNVVPEAEKSIIQIRRSLETFEKMTPQFERTLKQIGDLAQSGREFIPELRRTNDSLRELLGDAGDAGPAFKDILPELKKTNDEIRFFMKTSSFWVENLGVMVAKNEPRLTKAIDALTTTTERLGEIVNPENQKSINEILKNVKDASTRFERLTLGADDLMKDGQTAMKSLNATLVQGEQAIGEMRQTTKLLSERAPRILQNVETGSDQFNKMMNDGRELFRAIGRSEGSFSKFMTDPAIYNNLNEMTVTITKLAPRIDRILKDIEVFADKIARHPEALGVGGAIRPSAGLKESPTSPIIRPMNP